VEAWFAQSAAGEAWRIQSGQQALRLQQRSQRPEQAVGEEPPLESDVDPPVHGRCHGYDGPLLVAPGLRRKQREVIR
jgi:hypothetical protein